MELFGNGIDDNCDGRIDEPIFVYREGGLSNGPNGFDLQVRIFDQDTVDVVSTPYRFLGYEIEYQELEDTTTTWSTGVQFVGGVDIYLPLFASTVLTLDGLTPGTVYRARVQFYELRFQPVIGRIETPVGPRSRWYYTTTDGFGKVGQARTRLLLRGFYHYYLSEYLGTVGFRGRLAPDGTLYGAESDAVIIGEPWCGRFASWLYNHELADITGGGCGGWQYLPDHFGEHVSLLLGSWVSDCVDLMPYASRGDYLGLDTTGDGDHNHSNIFLAYDANQDILWTLDGNADGYMDDNLTPRKGGSEIVIRQSRLTTRTGLQKRAWIQELGLITRSLLLD
jgi:hypothetical protein